MRIAARKCKSFLDKQYVRHAVGPMTFLGVIIQESLLGGRSWKPSVQMLGTRGRARMAGTLTKTEMVLVPFKQFYTAQALLQLYMAIVGVRGLRRCTKMVLRFIVPQQTRSVTALTSPMATQSSCEMKELTRCFGSARYQSHATRQMLWPHIPPCSLLSRFLSACLFFAPLVYFLFCRWPDP